MVKTKTNTMANTKTKANAHNKANTNTHTNLKTNTHTSKSNTPKGDVSSSKHKKQLKGLDTPKPRQIRKPKRGRKVKTHLKQVRPRLPNSFKLFREAVKHVLAYPRVFFGITIVYLILTIALVKGFGVSSNAQQLKGALGQVFHGRTAAISSSFTIFTTLLGSVGNATTDVAGAYQTILLVAVSLALIWALRQTHSTTKPKFVVRDAFYKGLYPLIPFLLVLVVMGLQLIPLILSGALYNLVFNNGLAVHWYEQLGWGIGLSLLALGSIYMISSSVFALYIVTLPDVRPLQALRSARELVRYRRWSIIRKVVFLPLALLLTTALIIIPLILVAVWSVEWVFFILTMLSLAIVHSYMYSLYRKLL